MAAESVAPGVSAPFSLAIGTRVGRYEVIEGLARGGMGEVYLGRLSGDSASRVVALKVLRPELHHDESVRAMFLDEANTLLGLDHSSVVRAIELVQEGERDVLVMEYVRGHSASALLACWRDDPPTSFALAVDLVARVARAVHYVHEVRDADGVRLGLVHRDLSPDNIMVRPDGAVTLIDFGIARATVHTSNTSAGILKGKVSYMSPEQLRQDPLDRRSDVFQLGTLLFELVTRTHPFAANNFAATMNAVLSGDVPDPRERLPEIGDELAAANLRALEFEPEDRFETAVELADALEECLAKHADRPRGGDLQAELVRCFGDTTKRHPAPRGSGATTTPRSRSSWWLGVAALGVATLGGAAWAATAGPTAATEREAMGTLNSARVWVGLGAPERPCEDGSPCDLQAHGFCDAEHLRCAYAEPSCDSGHAFGPFAGTLAGACVEPWQPESRVSALPLDRPVTVDGDPTELMLGPPLVLSSAFGVRAEVWFGSDARGLYVGAVVDDPHIEASRPAYQPLWEEDGIEVLFDTDWDRSAGQMPGADDFKFVVTAINATSVSWGGVQPRTAWALPIESAVQTRGTINQAADADDGYSLELFIPWSDAFRRPDEGQAWGMNLQVNDRNGGDSRDVAWRTETPLNHPAGAGVLVFGREMADPRPAATPLPRTPKFGIVPLDGTVVSVDAQLRESQPIEHAWDACLAPRDACTVATDHASSVAAVFDLGQEIELAGARVFGDVHHDWVSRRWSLRVRSTQGEPWTTVVERADAFQEGWSFEHLALVRARQVELTVEGDDSHGVEFNEFQLVGRATKKIHASN